MSYLGNNNLPWDISRSSPIPTDAERFSGNSSTTTFTLTRSVNFPTDLEVFVENIQQEPTTAYTVNGNSLLFTEAPPTGTNNVYVVYRNYQSGAQVSLPDGSITYSKLANNIRVFTTDNFTANGNVSSYGLSEPPADANTVFVTVDGVVQRAPAHYTTSGSTITFTSAPPFSANVHIRHLGFRTTSTVTALPANSNISQPTLQGTTTANGNFLVTNGSVILSPGSVSAPALSFSGNTTTGMYMPLANTIAFTTAGTEDLRIDASGNVKLMAAGTKILNSSGNPILQQTGSILQVASTTLNTSFSMSGASFVAITGLTASITPTAASNKVLVQLFIGRVGPNIATGATVAFQILRDSTVVGAGTPSGSQLATSFVTVSSTNGNYSSGGFAFQFLDSPNTTSSVTYSVKVLGESSVTVYINRSYTGGTGATTYESASASTITVMEIAA
jgi:hypothetical protein